jgi:hypothetical protein
MLSDSSSLDDLNCCTDEDGEKSTTRFLFHSWRKSRVSDLTAFRVIEMLHSWENVSKFGGEIDIIESSRKFRDQLKE